MNSDSVTEGYSGYWRTYSSSYETSAFEQRVLILRRREGRKRKRWMKKIEFVAKVKVFV